LNMRISSKAKSALAATAYHEAGHALAHHVLGWGNGEVSIVADKECVGSARIGDGARLRRLLRQLEFGTINALLIAKCHEHILCLLAGKEAQRKFRPKSIRSYMARFDYSAAAEFLVSLYPDPKERNAASRYLVLRTRNLISGATHWRMIQDLAAALLKRRTLTGDEVSAIFESSKRACWAQRDSPRKVGQRHVNETQPLALARSGC
jgi:hypothetical protein